MEHIVKSLCDARVGVEIEFLFNPTPLGLAQFRKQHGIHNKGLIREAFRNKLSHHWYVEKMIQDGLSDELVTHPIELKKHYHIDYGSIFRLIMETNLYQLQSNFADVGNHFNFDWVDTDTFLRIIYLSIEISDLVYIISGRNGRSAELCDIHSLLGDHDYSYSKQALKDKATILVNSMNRSDNPFVCNVGHHNRRTEFRWFGATDDSNQFYLQLELSAAIYGYAKTAGELERRYFRDFIKKSETLQHLSKNSGILSRL